MEPLVSVIVPTHNRPDFLRKTLLSILNQTYSNLEIIVVSNGVSSINENVVLELADNRLKYCDQENSGGPAAPRNHGIRIATGEYIAFCDDDDLWMHQKIAKQVAALENNLEFGLCYTKMLRFDEHKEWVIQHEEGAASVDSLLYENTVPISSLIVRKAIIDQYKGFSESTKIGSAEDYEFILRLAFVSKFLFIDEYLIKYWSGGNRTTSVATKQTVIKSLKYLYYVFSCYKSVYKSCNTNIRLFMRPFLYHCKLTLKTILYINLNRVGLT